MTNNTFRSPEITYYTTQLPRDCSRVVTRQNLPLPISRIQAIVQRVLNLSDTSAKKLLTKTELDFSHRHKDLHSVWEKHYDRVHSYIPTTTVLSKTQKELIGAYFTMEYSIESAALFNPSIVLHPNQQDTKSGCQRFIMSLRATGEGHISSIVFRSGILTDKNTIVLDPISKFVSTQNVHVNPVYDRYLFQLKLNEMRMCNEITTHILNQLQDQFTYKELKNKIEELCQNSDFSEHQKNETCEIVYWLANSNYTMDFDPNSALSERVIFPVSKNESSGIEDARFVKFIDDNGEAIYYATYTAYNGFTILPQLIETRDFIQFKVITLNGKAVQNKGMALFPRKIDGKYVMLSRQDGVNNHIMFSDNLHFWQKTEVIQKPAESWEFLQIGNCGSPVETKHGWLVLTHGVGPMRQYSIGAMLLDLKNPRKIIARLKSPLLAPREEEREGYVPNVVYTCGLIIHNNNVIIPYAMSDTMSGVATVKLKELLDCMSKC